ncbi:MAG: sulfotransferase [Hormoscilla sp. GUM202]|nr:sulfotransferase [Hormoscilla sp. GUM202]
MFGIKLMSIGFKGNNLLFLISQPRAGSTLTQRILGTHSEIYTLSEPWLMLHPIYSLRANGYQAEYRSHLAQIALDSFLQMLPNGQEEYIEGIRKMYASLYKSALASSGKRYFLDKTPRYYLIIPELYRIFPEARFIILLRHPLAVMVSKVKKNTKGMWDSLGNHEQDFLQAPILLLEGIKLLGDSCRVLHYENLLLDPKSEISKVCNWLDIEFYPEILNYGLNDSPKWRFGDRKTLYKKNKPDPENADKWVQSLQDYQMWRLADDYWKLLGPDILNQMEYDYEKTQQTLDNYRPHWWYLWRTLPLKWLLKQREA